MSTPEEAGKVRLNGKVYEIPADYKVREYKLLTEMTGKQAISEIDFTDPNAIAAVALILLRRENPEFTEAELDEVTIGFVENGADAVPPSKTTRRAASGAQR